MRDDATTLFTITKDHAPLLVSSGALIVGGKLLIKASGSGFVERDYVIATGNLSGSFLTETLQDLPGFTISTKMIGNRLIVQLALTGDDLIIWDIKDTKSLGNNTEAFDRALLHGGTLKDGAVISKKGAPLRSVGGTISNISGRDVDLLLSFGDGAIPFVTRLTDTNSFRSILIHSGSKLILTGETTAPVKVEEDAQFVLGDGTTNGLLKGALAIDGLVTFDVIKDTAVTYKLDIRGTLAESAYITKDFDLITAQDMSQAKNFSSITSNLPNLKLSTELTDKKIILHLVSELAGSSQDGGGTQQNPTTPSSGGGFNFDPNPIPIISIIDPDRPTVPSNKPTDPTVPFEPPVTIGPVVPPAPVSRGKLIVEPTDVFDHGGRNENYTEVLLQGGSLRNSLVTVTITSHGGSLANIVGDAGKAGVLRVETGTTILEAGSSNQFSNVFVLAGATLINKGVTYDDLDNAGTVTNEGEYRANVASNVGAGLITNALGATWNGDVSNQATIVNNGLWYGVVQQSAGELRGTGRWSSIMTINGGVLKPGSDTPGTRMVITGALTLGANSTYRVTIDPTQSTYADVDGPASLNGTFSAIFLAGTYVTRDYIVLKASDGVFGTFTTVTNSGTMKFELVYNQNDVTLRLTADAAGDQQKGQLKTDTMRPVGNQLNVARTIDRYFNAGGKLPNDFFGLYALTGEGLVKGLAQLSGEVNTGAQTAAFGSMSRFLRLASDMQDSSRHRLLVSRNTTLWTAAIGGVDVVAGDNKLGTGRYTGRSGGMAMGAEQILSADRVVGFALAGASGNWNTRGMGNGLIDSFELATYMRQSFGDLDVTATLGLGQHWFGVDRTSYLQRGISADYTGQSVAGRLEGSLKILEGWRAVGVVQSQRFSAQGFTEKGNTQEKFLLSTGDQSGMQTRVEVGARFEDVFRLSNGMQVFLRTQASVSRSKSSAPLLKSSFTSLEGTAFDIKGTKPLRDAVSLSASLDVPLNDNVSIGARLDGEWTRNSRGVSGLVALRVNW